MPKFKVIEYRTTPNIFEVIAENKEDACDMDTDFCTIKELGKDDDFDVTTEADEVADDFKILVEYPIEN